MNLVNFFSLLPRKLDSHGKDFTRIFDLWVRCVSAVELPVQCTSEKPPRLSGFFHLAVMNLGE